MNKSSFEQNIQGVANLIGDDTNKSFSDKEVADGVVGQPIDELELNMSDDKLISLSKKWEAIYAPYEGKIKPLQDQNKAYYLGKTDNGSDKVKSANLIFEAEETFIPQALSKNPEPVVWSDNTMEGKQASDDIKTMLQYQAYSQNLRRKLGVMVRHWSIYYIGVMKHGYDKKINDIKSELRKPKNFILDPDGYVNENGEFIGKFLGERIESTAEELVAMFPKHKVAITLKADGKMGTEVVRTEWWTDEYSFTKFGEIILDKYKNPFFNYDKSETEVDDFGNESQTVTPGLNHFGQAKMPYTFLSVFSLQEKPHDITNLIEQSIPNQDRITDREIQISVNLAASNNSITLSGQSFDKETAGEAASALEKGHPILIPDGNMDAVRRVPANAIPQSVFQAQMNDKEALRSIFGTSGLSASSESRDTTARGMILNQNQDSSRIGGGVGEAIEGVAANIFNWWLQMMYVFYDEPHYASMVGNGQAVNYVQIINSNIDRHFIVKVEPNSMQPKDEITEQNLAIDLANKGWLDPINLFKKLSYPDPMETAKMVTLYKIDPMAYMQQFFPENAPMVNQPNAPDNPLDMNGIPTPQEQTLSAPPASSELSQVPLNTAAMPQ